MPLPKCARHRVQEVTPTKSQDIFKHDAYHPARSGTAAEDGHTPFVANPTSELGLIIRGNLAATEKYFLSFPVFAHLGHAAT